jgi:uncharacterized membrane protein HdeD (DUF308 family)
MARKLIGFLDVVLGVFLIMIGASEEIERGIEILLIITGTLSLLMGLWFLIYEPLPRPPRTPK